MDKTGEGAQREINLLRLIIEYRIEIDKISVDLVNNNIQHPDYFLLRASWHRLIVLLMANCLIDWFD
jgi:hypothetical protein